MAMAVHEGWEYEELALKRAEPAAGKVFQGIEYILGSCGLQESGKAVFMVAASAAGGQAACMTSHRT